MPPPKLYNFHHEPAPNLSEIVQVLGLRFVCLQPPQTPTNKNIPRDPPSHEVPPLKLECIQPLNDLFKERKVKVIFVNSYQAAHFASGILEGPFENSPKNHGWT